MGLFDKLTNLSSDQTQGLLGAAAALLQAGGPSRTPVTFGQALSGGILGFQQAQQAAQDRTAQQLLQSLRLKGLQGEIDDQERARKKANDFDQAARESVLTPGMQALAGGGGPTVENAARIPATEAAFDQSAFLSRAMGIDPIKALQLAQSLKKTGPKYDSGITWVNGPDGKPVAVRTADDGSFKTLDGLSPREKLNFLNLGGKTVGVNDYTGEQGAIFTNTATAGDLLSAATARRGQDITLRGQNMTDARERQNASKPVYDSERGVLINTRNGVASPIQNVDGSPLGSKDARQKTQDAKDVLSLLDQADPLIDKATSSFLGQGVDQAARLFGSSTAGSEAAAQLKAIEGSLVSKMPKMSGPQSDKDVLLYRQMAGQIGDPTVPAAAKKAAMSTIREINQRYLDGGQQSATAGGKVATLSDIAATARASGRSTAEVTAALRAKGYTIGGQ